MSAAPPQRSAAALPNQNQLYAYFMTLNGHMRIKKPNKAILELLEEDDASRNARLGREAALLHISPKQVEEQEEDPAVTQSIRKRTVALSSRSAVSLGSNAHPALKLHVGNRGLVCWLEVLRECPLLENMDLSGVTSIYAADPYSLGPSGNDVVELLASVCEKHPSIRSVDLRGHNIGTIPGKRLLDMCRRNTRIREVLFDEAGVDHVVVSQLKKQLNANVAADAPQGILPVELSAKIKGVQWVDRKTSKQRQALRNIFFEHRAFDSCSNEELDEMIENADYVSLETVVKDSAGLRGDREHLFILECGSLEVLLSNVPFYLNRGDYFGYQYEHVMYSAGMITEKERGNAFRIPLESCTAILKRWEASVDAHYSVVKRAVCFQSAHVWMLLRACHTAAELTFAPGEVVTSHSKPFLGLFVVKSGFFEVVHSDEKEASTAEEEERCSEVRRFVRGVIQDDPLHGNLSMATDELQRAKKALEKETSLSAPAADKHRHVFSAGDVFGEEPLTLKRLTTYATEIGAQGCSAAVPATHPGSASPTHPPAVCVLLEPEASTSIIQCQKGMFKLMTKTYTVLND